MMPLKALLAWHIAVRQMLYPLYASRISPRTTAFPLLQKSQKSSRHFLAPHTQSLWVDALVGRPSVSYVVKKLTGIIAEALARPDEVLYVSHFIVRNAQQRSSPSAFWHPRRSAGRSYFYFLLDVGFGAAKCLNTWERIIQAIAFLVLLKA